ncbi:DUF2625 family protein [Nocardia sp. NPDC051787]|uniref:DUF2625 family protein n=1 Tax=Nocardia sp. NPDC051787 TaxID=3155415 RepID=UPI0034354A30
MIRAPGARRPYTGGVLVDHGWLRVFGGGDPARRMPGLAEMSQCNELLRKVGYRISLSGYFSS